MPSPRRRMIVALVSVLASLLSVAALAPWALGMTWLEGDEAAPLPRSPAELEARWDEVLEGVVHDDGVDYARLRARRASLASLVGALARFGPRTAPDAGWDSDHRFAYYINAYNILTVFAVIERGVRESVHEVRGPLEPIQGLGFFWAQRFRLDGERVHLHGLENDRMRADFSDARLHAAINCASASCPALAHRAYHGQTLEAELRRAAAAFTRPPHVVIDREANELRLSAIYDWYEEDFVAHARVEGAAPSPLGWIMHHGEVGRFTGGEALTIRFVEYDWSLNSRP